MKKVLFAILILALLSLAFYISPDGEKIYKKDLAQVELTQSPAPARDFPRRDTRPERNAPAPTPTPDPYPGP